MSGIRIKVHSTETFRDRYMPAAEIGNVLRPQFGRFFVVRVEEMIRMIRLPVPPVRSTTHSLIYLTEGEAIMTIGSHTYTIHKDQCLIVPAGQVYSFSNLDENKGYLFNFHDDFFIESFWHADLTRRFAFLNVWSRPDLQLGAETSAGVRQLCSRLLALYEQDGLNSADIIRTYFMALLCEVETAATQPALNSRRMDITRQFLQLLQQYFKTHQLTGEYAAMLHISPNHLNKAVRSASGKSPALWINEYIVQEAKVLLYQSNDSILDIARAVGMSDPSYFARLFRRHEGITPLAYRKRIARALP